MRTSVLFLSLLLLPFVSSPTRADILIAPINCQAVVSRHNPTNLAADSLSSLSVGNGHLATTVDVTGLQSFPEAYRNGVPLTTMSDWGWHSFPNTDSLTEAETQRIFRLQIYDNILFLPNNQETFFA